MPASEERRPTWKLLTLAHDGSVKDTIALGNALVVGDMAWSSVQDELGVMYVKGFRLEEESATSGGP